MNVKDVMRKEVFAIRQDASLKEMVELFCQRRVGSIPVIDASQRVIGMVSVEDLIHIFMPKFHGFVKDFASFDDYGVLESVFMSQSQHPSDDRLILVADILHSSHTSVAQKATLLEAAAIMEGSKVKSLCVVDKKQHLKGIITHTDIVLSILSGVSVAKKPKRSKKS